MAESVSSQDNMSELAELKEQMSEMFKILKALQSEKEKSTQAVNAGPVGNPTQAPKSKPSLGVRTSQRREEPTKWPLYGLPPDYVPPYENEIYEENPHEQFDANMEQPTPQVQHLIDSNWLNFKQSVPNVSNNPLPNHGVNAIEDVQDHYFLKDVFEIRTSMKVIFEEMCNQCMIEVLRENREGEECCEIHGEVGHVIEECAEFKMLLQKMMDTKLVVVGRRFASSEINAIGENKEVTTFTPSLVRFEQVLNIPRGMLLDPPQQQWFPYLTKMEPILLNTPHPFPYESDKAVPWKYGGEVVTPLEHSLEVTNLDGVSRITRRGRVYVPPEIGKNAVTIYKGKEKVDVPIAPEIGPEGVVGLGYNPTKADKAKVANEAKKKKWARIRQFEYKAVETLIPHIQHSFVSAGFEFQGSVSMLEEKRSCQLEDYVFHCTPGTVLNNWVEIEAPSSVFWEDK
ncbi:hypothetical protein Lal_00026193 [Lupinus albus]|nr:hypothetical protein Lal_00026193 [Lupinus albus]